ncbi:MAG: AAA family ATPase [Candidatus Lambdaproteobacteria bacterium]|nr:AAA family ATPase [Candidatus Lambdaproteobacteria bacterium]
MTPLRDRLEGLGYRLTEELARQVDAALATRPTAGSFLAGTAGAGKTFLAEAVSRVEGCETFFFQAFPGCRKEEFYQTILPDAAQPSGFRTVEGVLPRAAHASQHGRTALILDEWDKTHPSTDAFLLDFLQTGRISIPGSQVRARQENLIVFVTLNDERELSEPLLRRLPMIELKPPPPALVEQALADTHADHAYIPAAVALYRRSRLVNLTKPVTIQELRQLLDAISRLGTAADWNRLVFQFVTKSWDDHELLKSSESIPLEVAGGGLETEKPVLDAARYQGESASPPDAQRPLPRMPLVVRPWLDGPAPRPVEADAERIYGVVPRTDSGYDGVARAALAREALSREALSREALGPPITDPADLRIAQVGERQIVVYEALDFARIEEWGLILKDGGELLLEARHGGELSREMLQAFRKGQLDQAPDDPERCRIYSMTERELLMRYRTLKLRWTPQTLEVLADDLAAARELWEALYGERGAVTAQRQRAHQAREQEQHAARQAPAQASNAQLRDEYLAYMREYKHLREWISLCIERNVRVWGRITCAFEHGRVRGSLLPSAEFNPDSETPASRDEAEAIAAFVRLTQPALDYYESHLAQIESELTLFVAKNGELPPAVEDGGLFALSEIHSDLQRIKREGLRVFMRKGMREA